MNFISRIIAFFRRSSPAPAAAATRSFAAELVKVATQQAALGIRETSHNHGPGIEKFWTATSYGPAGYRNREPWCAAFLCWVVKQAALGHYGESPPFRLPRSAAVNDWPAWAQSQPAWKVVKPSPVKAGDIICWDFNGRDNSGGTHIGLAISNERADGTFDTIEGNTNAEGSRDGNGVYHRTTRTRKAAFAILRPPL